MKKMLSKLISLCFVIAMMLSVTVTAFAAEGTLTINGEAQAKVGDTVKFSLYLDECTEDIIGFELRLFYDEECLQMDPDSITYEKFDGVIHNTKIPGKLPISWTNISQPADFSSKAQFLSVDFKVLKAGDSEISYFVTDMYGDDMTYLKSYKWTYDISVNDESVVSDKTPPVSRDEETLKTKQGSFINYIDGMGEENSPNKEHEAIKTTEIVTHYKEVTQSNQSGDSNVNMTYIIIAVAIGIIVIAIIAIVIVKKRDENAKNAVTSENSD